MVWAIWRCRLVRSTTSWSTSVIRPTPAAARYSARANWAASANDQCVRARSAPALDADFVEQDVAGIAQELVVGHGWAGPGRKRAGCRPRWLRRRLGLPSSFLSLRSVWVLLTSTGLARNWFSAWASAGSPCRCRTRGLRLAAAFCLLFQRCLRASLAGLFRGSAFLGPWPLPGVFQVGLAGAARGEGRCPRRFRPPSCQGTMPLAWMDLPLGV